MSARIALRVLLLAAALCCASRSEASGPWGLARGEWYSRVENGAFSSRSVYLDSGHGANTGIVFEKREFSTYNELGWKKGMTFFFRLPAVSLTLRDDQGALLAPRTTLTRTGFQDGQVGMKFRVLEGQRPVAIEVAWTGPLGYDRTPSAAGPALGDGLQQLGFEMNAGTSLLGRMFVQASAGRAVRFLGLGGLLQAVNSYGQFMRNRSAASLQQGPNSEKSIWSDRLTASADVGIWASPSVLVGGSYRGFVTVAAGPLAADVNLHMAGPVVLYRVDDRLDVYAGSWSTTGGRNTLRYSEVYAGIAFHKTKLNRLQGFMGGKQSP